MVLISEVDEVEIFKICLEYWNALCADMYRERPYQAPPLCTDEYRETYSNHPSVFPLKVAHTVTLRRQFYATILSQVKKILISYLTYFVFLYNIKLVVQSFFCIR